MVSVNPTNVFLTTAETDVECLPIDGRELLDGLRQQLALSDRFDWTWCPFASRNRWTIWRLNLKT